jgi:hypothetical protein
LLDVGKMLEVVGASIATLFQSPAMARTVEKDPVQQRKTQNTGRLDTKNIDRRRA